MKYVTLADLSQTIRKNFYKIPHDIDFVIGIPRSGMICASIISEFLNVPLIDIDSFCSGAKPTGGGRLRYYNQLHADDADRKKKALVVDDTVFNGTSKIKARKQLEPFSDKHQFIVCAVYLEGPSDKYVDFYLEDVSMYTHNYRFPVLYEWNIFHHNENIMKKCIYDIDGVLCVNPPNERNEEAYIDYIKNAIPLFTPTTMIGELLTYRLCKNREITVKWLEEHNIKYGKLNMFKAGTWDERNQTGISSEEMKGAYYKKQDWALLFVESDDWQAREIFRISGKPVFCVESNKLYTNF